MFIIHLFEYMYIFKSTILLSRFRRVGKGWVGSADRNFIWAGKSIGLGWVWDEEIDPWTIHNSDLEAERTSSSKIWVTMFYC